MKKGAILAISLGFITLLTSIIYLFLQLSIENKTKQNREYITLQMSGLIANLSEYLKELEFTDEMLFYASKMKLPIQVGNIELMMGIQSANKTISLNQVLHGIIQERSSEEKSNVLKLEDKLVDYLRDYRVRNSKFLVDLLLDTADADDEARSYQSEMVEFNARVYNGRIVSYRHLLEVLEYYALTQNDVSVYDVPWEKTFNFDNITAIDLNHASFEALRFLFGNENLMGFKQLSEHRIWYEEVEDLPFNDTFRKTVIGKHFGTDVSIKSSVAIVQFEVDFQEFKAVAEFKKTIGKNSSIYDIHIIEQGY